jgi:hypothetical protein
MAINPLLNWRKPIDLPAGKSDPALKQIPVAPGIYVFFREHGNSVQIFYVGKALKLQGRVKGQLNNHSLMTAISNAKNGRRKVAWADLQLRPGQTLPAALKAAERLMIRHYVEDGQPVHNVQGKRIAVQTLTNNLVKGVRHFVPSSVAVDA